MWLVVRETTCRHIMWLCFEQMSQPFTISNNNYCYSRRPRWRGLLPASFSNKCCKTTLSQGNCGQTITMLLSSRVQNAIMIVAYWITRKWSSAMVTDELSYKPDISNSLVTYLQWFTVLVTKRWTQRTNSQIAKFMGPTWGPPGSCRPQMGPMLAPMNLAIRVSYVKIVRFATSLGISAMSLLNTGSWRWHVALIKCLFSGHCLGWLVSLFE